MKQLCTRCLLIGTGRHGLFSGNKYIAIAQISLGIALIATNVNTLNFSEFSTGRIIILIIAILSIIVGILNIRDSLRPGQICPKCGNPGMLVIESPEGQQFITRNNISIPKEKLKE